jgi:hypothetical protein
MAGDIAVEAPLDDFSEGAARYAACGDWRVGFGALGLEASGDLEPGSEDAYRHWIGPVVSVNANDRFAVELSYLPASPMRRLTRRSACS